MFWLDSPAHARWLESHTDQLLAFGRPSASPRSGFAWLNEKGRPERTRPVELWITARQTHVYALGALLGRPGCATLVDHGIAALTGPFADPVNGGWYSSVTWDGDPLDTSKEAYTHAFVILAASSAVAAGRPGAEALLEAALANSDRYFWEEPAGAVVEGWDQGFANLDSYRGANANMHTTEAYLAAADVTGLDIWRERALRIMSRLIDTEAKAAGWRIPEHYNSDWVSLPDYNRELPEDRFRPYGVTPGHGMEWSRLVLEARAALGEAAPAWMLQAAQGLFARALQDGWSEGGQPGFCYTTDFEGRAVVRLRLHWVAAEATGAAATAYRATGDPQYAEWYQTWWEYVANNVIDHEHGSWHHELSPQGRVSSEMWPGKPDLYHAVQATLIPRLPLAPSFATALARGLLGRT
ncbi:MAG: AGE family epimerase/isomerase [Bifidobacteriaceae bacterium]|nr:AGE family epimerase/isomerase [Bifidobacteriaceae bacterium]